MGEPARKLQDIEPDIKPDLGMHISHRGQGDGSSTPERDSMKLLDDMENNPDKKNSSGKSVAEQEADGGNTQTKDKSWKDSTEPREYKDANGKTPIKMSLLRKKGPLGLILGVTLGGGGLLAMLFSPGLLILQIKEMMVGKFNMQLTSMDIRTTRKINAKIGGTVGGMCTGISVLCRYQTMSPKQVANFQKAGITIKNKSTFLGGRVRPTDFEFNGNNVKAKDFTKTMKNNVEFRSAVKNGYNPKFAGYADTIWKKAARRLGIGKAKVKFDGDDIKAKTEDFKKSIEGPEGVDDLADSITSKVDPDTGKTIAVDKNGNDLLDSNGNKVPWDEYKKTGDLFDDAVDFDDAIKKTGDLIDEGDEVVKEIAQDLAGGGTVKKLLKKGQTLLNVTGAIDNACTVYNTVRAVGFAAKTVRAFQLARYAMKFLRMADQIKGGGNPAPEDVAYLGDILTKEISGAGKVIIRSAGESFGYKYAAYGDKGKLPSLSMQFLAGGGLTGDLIHLTSYINLMTAGIPEQVCGTLNNPVVQIGSLAAGIAILVGSGGLSGGAKAALVAGGKQLLKSGSFYANLGLVAANLILPSLLKNIIAGNIIDDSTVGEKAMEAITSGSSGIMAKTASFGGNAPLNYEQAASYTKMALEVEEQYAEEDRLAYSPFDISNSNTFMGRLVASLVPYIIGASNPANMLSSISSIVTGSMSIAIDGTSAKADTAEDYKNWCKEDVDYKYEDKGGLGLATDPYCNIIYGVPVEAIKEDPIQITRDLYNANQIDGESGDPLPGSDYSKFIDECIERQTPLGFTGKSGTEANGSKCLWGELYGKDDENIGINNSKFYLHHIDQRVEAGMSGDDDVLNAATDFGYISFYDPIEDNSSDIALDNFVTDIEKIDEIGEKATESVVTMMERPSSTINKCNINNPEDRLLGLDVLCGGLYLAPLKNGDYAI